MLAPVTSIAQILAFPDPNDPKRLLARNWEQVRSQSGSGQTTYSTPTAHLARDIYLPKGSKLYLPFAMIYDHTGTSNEDGSDSMGYVVVFVDEKRRWWRFIHIAKANQGSFRKGMIYPAGTYIGTTSFHDLGDSKSHLHLDVGQDKSCTKGGSQCIDPIGALGVEGWNTMVTGKVNTSLAVKVGSAGIKIALAALVGGLLFVGIAKFMRGRAPVAP